MKSLAIKQSSSIVVAIALVVALSGCASHKTEVLLGGLVGASAGAGLGYAVVHHGMDNKYEVQNTIITSAVVGLLVIGALAYHYNALDNQKVEIMSSFSRSWMQDPANQNKVMPFPGAVTGPDAASTELSMPKEAVGKYSLELDDKTRWVYPTFRRRYQNTEAGNDQLTAGHDTWEIVRPGFFISKETHPWYFDEAKNSSTEPPVETPAPAPQKSKSKNKKD